MMGYGAEDSWSDAKPAHQVKVKPFQMAKTLVTNKQYKACVDVGACTPAHGLDGDCLIWTGQWEKGKLPVAFQADDQPVVCVDWEQARAFSEWLGGRLPSEAEWEYAARSAGKEYKYPWGNEDATCERAVINEGGLGCGRNSTWPVCSKPQGNTEQGLCDMAGNVWVWVQDWYHDSYTNAPGNGRALESPTGAYRASRGGSWAGDAGRARSAIRGYGDPARRNAFSGLRPARASELRRFSGTLPSF